MPIRRFPVAPFGARLELGNPTPSARTARLSLSDGCVRQEAGDGRMIQLPSPRAASPLPLVGLTGAPSSSTARGLGPVRPHPPRPGVLRIVVVVPLYWFRTLALARRQPIRRWRHRRLQFPPNRHHATEGFPKYSGAPSGLCHCGHPVSPVSHTTRTGVLPAHMVLGARDLHRAQSGFVGHRTGIFPGRAPAPCARRHSCRRLRRSCKDLPYNLPPQTSG
ncbi:MAG: hypothetical protein UX72_C0005G0032 [Parcubacteria group bacterium GW2011_GWA2_47_10]|nr:MAG: hypothetical protein UX72_C0005G0032 [Parcubacteria group bacterium GW2011_GWA2_47_10]